jgi:hypothetical protein
MVGPFVRFDAGTLAVWRDAKRAGAAGDSGRDHAADTTRGRANMNEKL